jgi:hypothetical protein
MAPRVYKWHHGFINGTPTPSPMILGGPQRVYKWHPYTIANDHWEDRNGATGL